MTIAIQSLIDDLRVHAPMGIELPRNPDDNKVNVTVITRWAQDAAGALNGARGATTLKETTITTTADVQDYALPADCRSVVKIQRGFDAPAVSGVVLDVPIAQGPFLGYGNFGNLPSGQEISPAIDLINRQRLVRNRREDQWEMFGGQLRLEFPTVDGEQIRVTYNAIDRSLASLPDDYFTPLLIYLRWQTLEWYVQKYGVAIAQDGDRLTSDRVAVLNRQARVLEERWQGFLNGLTPEV
jgi:hypothetical protein